MKGKKARLFSVILIFTFIQSFVFGYLSSKVYATNGITVAVTDSSNTTISTGFIPEGSALNNSNISKDSNGVLNPVKIVGSGSARISYSLNGATTGKYSIIKATDPNVIPTFPSDSSMSNVTNIPDPNTQAAYKTDLGLNGYISAKHFVYNGNPESTVTPASRTQSFGVPYSSTMLVQKAKISTDINELTGTSSTNAFLSDGVVYDSETTQKNSASFVQASWNLGHYYRPAKIAAWKAMKIWGYYVPDTTGYYELGANSDDGAYGYLIINRTKTEFVNDWTIAAANNRSLNNAMYLTANKYYPIYMEWYEGCPTNAAFTPVFRFSSTQNGSFTSWASIPDVRFYSSKTTTPGDVPDAYFSDESGISFPQQDGTYYVATKFANGDNITSGLFGPYVVDNTAPAISNLNVTTDNSYNNNYAVGGSQVTATFTVSENLKTDPQILLNGNNTNAIITKDNSNHYTARFTIGTNGICNGNTVNEGPINVQVGCYVDLYGNLGETVEDNSVTFDKTAPTLTLGYKSNPIGIATQIITATYSEPISNNDSPKISINQPGSLDVTLADMSQPEGATDRTTWVYNYLVNEADNSNYIDGTANVLITSVHDKAGNSSNVTNSNFVINTVLPTVNISYSSNPTSVGTTTIFANLSEPIKNGEPSPKISIMPRVGTTALSVSQANMTYVDSKTWKYDYTINAGNNGTVDVTLPNIASLHNALGNAFTPQQSALLIDTTSPSVNISYAPNSPVKNGIVTITATYSELIKQGQIPSITINQAGTSSDDLVPHEMTMGTDRSNWSYDYYVNKDNNGTFKDGLATVVLTTIQDSAGNNSTLPTNNNFTIDTKPPTLSISSPLPSSTKDTPVVYTITYSEADNITLRSTNVKAITTLGANGTPSVSMSNTDSNIYYVTVNGIGGTGTIGIEIDAGTATDNAGNSIEAPADSTTFNVDNTNPVVTFSPVSNITAAKNHNTIVYITDDSSVPTIQYQWTASSTFPIGGTWTNFSSGAQITKSNGDGDYYLQIKAIDALGNEANETSGRFVFDNTAPDPPSITSPITGTKTSDNTPQINGTTEANATVSVYVDNSFIGTVNAGNGGGWTYRLAAIDTLADGVHNITAKATDTALNESEFSNIVAITVDTIALAPLITSPVTGTKTKDKTPSIAGKAEANSTVRVYYDGDTTPIGTAPVNSSGDWALTPGTQLSDGIHSISAKITDDVGNISPSCTPVSITIDTKGPDITVEPYNGNDTNKDVTVSITTVEGSVNQTSHTFTDNGSFDFIATDALGNQTKQTITINNIVKVVFDAQDPVILRQNDSKTITISAGKTPEGNNSRIDTTSKLSYTITSGSEFLKSVTVSGDIVSGIKMAIKANSKLTSGSGQVQIKIYLTQDHSDPKIINFEVLPYGKN
jgi:hypothetical protein